MQSKYWISTTLIIYFILFVHWANAKSSREKRFVIVNPFGNIVVALLWQAPVSLILPTISFKKDDYHDDYSYDHNDDDDDSYGRSFKDADHQTISPNDLQVDPGYVRQTDKVQSYLSLLQVDSMTCQERLLCEMAAETRDFAPISELLLQHLKQNHGPVTQSSDNLMWRYMVAAREGMASMDLKVCQQAYKYCQTPGNKMINMSVLKVWQFINSILSLKMV